MCFYQSCIQSTSVVAPCWFHTSFSCNHSSAWHFSACIACFIKPVRTCHNEFTFSDSFPACVKSWRHQTPWNSHQGVLRIHRIFVFYFWQMSSRKCPGLNTVFLSLCRTHATQQKSSDKTHLGGWHKKKAAGCLQLEIARWTASDGTKFESWAGTKVDFCQLKTTPNLKNS